MKKFRIIITIILFLMTIGIGYGIYYYGKTNIKLDKDYTKLVDNLVSINNEINNSDNSSSVINKNIEDLNNIENIIVEKQKNVYKLGSDLEKQIRSGNNKYKIAYLTFDDGPYYNTFNVFKVLKEHNVKATFFTTDTNGSKCYDNRNYDCRNMYAYYKLYGHTIANHTYTHSIFSGLYSSTSNFMNAIINQENLIKSKTGLTPNIMRFPGGSATAGSLRNSIKSELYKRGYGWVDWTAQDGDGGNLSGQQQARNNFQSSINEDIEVVLFHDYSNITTPLLPEFIKYLEDRNYILLPLFYESVMVNKG